MIFVTFHNENELPVYSNGKVIAFFGNDVHQFFAVDP